MRFVQQIEYQLNIVLEQLSLNNPITFESFIFGQVGIKEFMVSRAFYPAIIIGTICVLLVLIDLFDIVVVKQLKTWNHVIIINYYY